MTAQEAGNDMASEGDDAVEAAARLEAALERIARIASPHIVADPERESDDLQDPVPPIDEIAARLDTLIDRLRAALGSEQD